MGSDILDWYFEHIVPWIILVFIGGVVLAVPFAIYGWYQDSKSPTMALKKSEWACTQLQTIPITTYVQSGKVMIPITTYTKQCNQWNRQ